MIEELIGLTEEEAYLKMRDFAEMMAIKLSIRIEKRDGVEYKLSTDTNNWRFNLTIENGIVVGVRMG